MFERGFTLIEVLVAVAIIGVMALAVGIGLSGLGGTRELEHQARRLQAHLEWACEAAELDGRSIGLRQTPDGYDFLERRLGAWQPVKAQAALASWRLPVGMRLHLRRDGEALAPATAATSAPAPDLACFPSGEMTPFVADLDGTGADRRYRLTGRADGHIQLEAIDAPR